MNSTLSQLVARRDLIGELVRSDFKSSSAETRLGVVWWLLDPLLMMGIYWVFMVLIFGRDKYSPYPVFVGCGLLAWKHLSASLNKAANTLHAHDSVIKSIPFPTMVLPVSVVASQFVHFLFGFLVLFGAALGFGLAPGLHAIQIPALMLCQVALVTGAALAISCIGVLVRDIAGLTSHALRIGWYLSPGIYGVDLVASRFGAVQGVLGDVSVLDLYMLNPFAILFTGYRMSLHTPGWIPADWWAILALESACVLLLGYLVYQHYDRRVIKFI